MADQFLKGFTLIELLIAIFVLVVGIVGVIAMIPLATQVGKSSQMVSVATQLGQSELEEIIPRSYAEIGFGTTTQDYGEIADFWAFKRVTEVSCFDPNGPGISPDCPDSGIKKIEVTVFWRSPLGATEKNIKIVSLISKR